jgi:hypothetical protein
VGAELVTVSDMRVLGGESGITASFTNTGLLFLVYQADIFFSDTFHTPDCVFLY